ncbi:YggS family pyridoxal phosphate-dependent enzyme [Enterococcus sp. HY326]|uniref:YggS family pyridoxal phosphate-dependent enzyme n=1 Tax=Enterococcus sp. HY326 TaxID=2971265 RepID=UPI00223F6E1B|nr:YggS family pyridoxal phosphate-dependent enzyme [Enterococcus sp. HY326]
MISDNLNGVYQKITEACVKAKRQPSDVTLVAVTKSVDAVAARQLVENGVINLAENRVDKLLEKQHDLKDQTAIKWHLIGNLQRRKVKDIINQIDYFHALDSLRLAQEIEKRAETEIKCFVEVNISGEASKHGFSPEEVLNFVNELKTFQKVKVIGLMTMAPLTATEAEIRVIFKQLKKLQTTVQDLEIEQAPCSELSMGMSNDFGIAIEEGSTFIRVGRMLFGAM